MVEIRLGYSTHAFMKTEKISLHIYLICKGFTYILNTKHKSQLKPARDMFLFIDNAVYKHKHLNLSIAHNDNGLAVSHNQHVFKPLFQFLFFSLSRKNTLFYCWYNVNDNGLSFVLWLGWYGYC